MHATDRRDARSQSGPDLMNTARICPRYQKLVQEWCELDSPRSVRHFISDARSELLPFTEVYFMDLAFNRDGELRAPKHAASAESRPARLRLYFMLRERDAGNLFDMDSETFRDAPRVGFDGRIQVAFDVTCSTAVTPQSRKSTSKTATGAGAKADEPDLYDDAAKIYDQMRQLYGIFYAPLNEPLLLQLDTRFPHSRSAPQLMLVEFQSLVGAKDTGKTALQHAAILKVFKTLRHFERGASCIDFASLPFFATYFKRLFLVYQEEAKQRVSEQLQCDK